MKQILLTALLCLLVVSSCTHLDTLLEETPVAPVSINVKNLRNLPEGFAEKLEKTLNTETVYFIVHPSYYVFFHEKPFQIIPDDSNNVVETFIGATTLPPNSIVHLLREYQQNERDFIASAEDDKRIVILVLPGRYLNSKDYIYKNGATDEYARYLNDTTRNAKTVFYIESKSTSTGKLNQDELDILLNFLQKIGARRIYIGGGYIGRCQEQFYDTLVKVSSDSTVAIVPEISAISPSDITDSTAKMLLTPDMKLNTWSLNYFIKNKGLKSLRNNVAIENITPSWRDDRKPSRLQIRANEH